MSREKIIASIVSLVVIWIVYFCTLPVLNVGYLSGFYFIGFAAIVIVLNIVMWVKEDIEDMFLPTIIAVVVFSVIGILTFIIGLPVFNVEKIKSQLPEAEVREFNEDIAYIDLTQVPIVDEKYAAKLADKKLGEDPTLGSQVDVGEFTMQNVNGELILVAPLVHSGIFQWKSNSDGTPGYITVSASNPQDVRLVQELDGEDIKIVYQPEAYFKEDLKRHIYSEGYGSIGTTDYSFELDDEGRPYWVITTYKNETLHDNPNATGVIIVDARTGETTSYSVEETPSWVDRIQPMDFISRQIKNQGTYIEGAFNFENKGKFEQTEGMAVVYNDGKCYYYTGLTSVGSDEATIGFYLIDTRTKEVIKYNINGAHENAAMKSLEGKVQDFGYIANFPIPVNVEGQPTYFMSLKDQEGLIKSFGFVNISDYSLLAVGETVREAEKNYINAMNNSGNVVGFNQETYQKEVVGIIERIDSKVESGNTTYIYLLENDSNLYLTSSIISDELTITMVGDSVVLKYNDTGSSIVNVIEFDNINIDTTKSENQQIVDERVEKAEEHSTVQDTLIIVKPEDILDEEWNNFSDEEKSKILEDLKSK